MLKELFKSKRALTAEINQLKARITELEAQILADKTKRSENARKAAKARHTKNK